MSRFASRYRTKKGALAAAAAVTLLLAAGCSAGTSGSSSSGGAHSTVTVAYNNTVSTLDPSQANFEQEDLVDETAYDTLVQYNAQNVLVGSLATQFSLTNGAKTIDITLRSGVHFHNGALLTAKDIAYTLDRDAKLGTGVAQYIKGYQSTTVVNDTHLVIQLSQPNSLFLPGLSIIYILNSALVQQHLGTNDGQAWLATHDAGSGPYEFAANMQPQSGTMTVDRFSGYWNYTSSRPSQVVYRLLEETSAQAAAVKSGQIDLTTALEPRDAATLTSDSSLKMLKILTPTMEEVYFNLVSGPTTNLDLRRAIQDAFDYSGGLKEIHSGQGVIANGPLPSSLPCNPGTPQYTQNLAAAKDLLAKSGYKHVTLTLNYQTYDQTQVEDATLFQSDLKQIGINVQLVPIQFPDYLSRLSNRSTIPQMMLAEDFSPMPDPGVMLVNYYTATAIGSNRTGLDDPAVDTLLNSALASTSSSAACNYYKAAEKDIYNTATQVSLYTLISPFAYSNWLQGVRYLQGGPWIPDLRV